MLNDLHIHTTYSDGAFTPDEIIEAAIEKKIRYISITDHDTLNAYGNYTPRSEITIIPGVEISTYYKGMEIHVLSYFHDPFDRELRELLEKVKVDRVERYRKILENLRSLGLELPTDAPPLDSYGRAHIAKLLLSGGHVRTFREAFSLYLDVDKLAYEKRFKIDARDAVKLLSAAGGTPCIAHPGEKLLTMHFEDLLLDLKSCGMQGLEVYHPSHTREQMSRLYSLGRKYQLAITGGSDFHGRKGAPMDLLGKYGVNEMLLKKLTQCSTRRIRKLNK